MKDLSILTSICNLRNFLFENITEPLLVVIKDRVSMAIEKYESQEFQ